LKEGIRGQESGGRIIDMKKNSQDTSDLENHIDQLDYKLYSLTPEEIGVVEG